MTPRDKVVDLKSFEKFLRVRGFSRSEAKIVASAGFKKLVQLKAQQDHTGAMTSPCP